MKQLHNIYELGAGDSRYRSELKCFTYDKEEAIRMAAKLLREDIVKKLDDVSNLSWPPTLRQFLMIPESHQIQFIFFYKSYLIQEIKHRLTYRESLNL